jgi:hypothetical protein
MMPDGFAYCHTLRFAAWLGAQCCVPAETIKEYFVRKIHPLFENYPKVEKYFWGILLWITVVKCAVVAHISIL